MRRLARRNFEAWCRIALNGEEFPVPAKHHRLICDTIQKTVDGEHSRVMFCLPPGSGKSKYISELLPPWFLQYDSKNHSQRKFVDERVNPYEQGPAINRTIICASNVSNLAEDFSRKVQQRVRDNSQTLQYTLLRENAELWNTSNGGVYRAAGVGGTITGRRADLVIIDDPVKSREQSESPDIREKQWNWFISDLRTRLRPNAKIILVMTRWHHDDLGGRLLIRQPNLWKVVSIPAICESEKLDPLKRSKGQYLWDDDEYGYADELKKVYAEYVEAGAMRDWYALYQQSPRAAEGSLFKTSMIQVLPVAPAKSGKIVRAWDLAATKQMGTKDPDWTVGIKFERTSNNQYIVHDVVRFRGGPDDVESSIINIAAQDGKNVVVGLPVDPGQAGIAQVQYLTSKLAGYKVESSSESGDKETRAAPVASQCNVGNLKIVQGNWNHIFINELADFPNAKKDQVDALSRAFMMVSSKGMPLNISPDAIKNALGRM